MTSISNAIDNSGTTTTTTTDTDRLGQRYAFALASLAVGISCFFNIFGLEKALLAVAFGVLAFRPPVARLRPSWAKAGIGLGALSLLALLVVAVFFNEQMVAFIEHLKAFR